MNPPRLRHATRRQVLAGGVGVVAAATLAAPVLAAPRSTAELPAISSVVLHDPRFALPADVRQRLQGNRARIVMLAGDPVRAWRDELGASLQPAGARLLGVTRWPEFLLLRGLAAESRRHVRYERLDAATGAMVWLIA